MIQTLYPNQVKTTEESNFELVVKLWQKLFDDVMFSEVVHALMKHAVLNKFAPHPSELREIIAKFRNPDAFKTSEQAWEEVLSAVRKYGFYRQLDAFESFEPKIKRIVKMLGWSTICHSEKIEFIKRDFCKIWDSSNKDEKENLMLPTELARQILAKVQEIPQINSDSGELK